MEFVNQMRYYEANKEGFFPIELVKTLWDV